MCVVAIALTLVSRQAVDAFNRKETTSFASCAEETGVSVCSDATDVLVGSLHLQHASAANHRVKVSRLQGQRD